MPIQVSCPNCGKTYGAPESVVNKPVTCKNCGNSFVAAAVVPSPGAPAVAPAPPTAPAAAAAPPPKPAAAVAGPEQPTVPPPLPAIDTSGGGAPSVAAEYLNKTRRPGGRRLWILVGVAAAVILVLVVGGLMIFGPLSGGGLPDWAAVPPDARGVGYANLDRLRSSPLFKKYEDKIPRMAPNLRTEMTLDDLSEFFGVFMKGNDSVVFLRTNKDLELETVVTEVKDSGREKKYKDRDWVLCGRWVGTQHCVAKIDDRTFVDAQHEEDLFAVFDVIDGRERAGLDERLWSALKPCTKHDVYMAMLVPEGQPVQFGLPGGPPTPSFANPQVYAFGGSAGSKVSFEFRLIYESKEAAAQAAKSIQDYLDQIKDTMSAEGVPAEHQQTADDVLEMLGGVKVYQSGDGVSVKGSWASETVERMLDRAPF